MTFRILLLSSVWIFQLGSLVPAYTEDCETNATNMAEVRACLDNELESELADAFDGAQRFIKVQSTEAAELLLTAQTSWKKFAEDSCNYSVAARQTSQLENDARLACWSTFARARIKILNAYRRDFGKTDF